MGAKVLYLNRLAALPHTESIIYSEVRKHEASMFGCWYCACTDVSVTKPLNFNDCTIFFMPTVFSKLIYDGKIVSTTMHLYH